MILASKKWWWEGYAALVWSACLVIPVFCWAEVFHYILWAALAFSPFGLLFGISAIRRGSPLAKAAAVVALFIALMFVYLFIICKE
jgi:hypothetical protein